MIFFHLGLSKTRTPETTAQHPDFETGRQGQAESPIYIGGVSGWNGDILSRSVHWFVEIPPGGGTGN